MKEPLKTYSHDISRGYLIGFISLLVGIPCVILFVIMLYENQIGNLSDLFLMIGAIVWLVVFAGGLILFITSTSRRRKKWLDHVLNPLGLSGNRYLINWWEYRGRYAGRSVKARFYKGPTFDLIFSTSLMTHFGVTKPNEWDSWLAAHLNKTPVAIPDPLFTGFTAFASDEEWFNQLYARPSLSAALLRLLTVGAEWALVRQVILAPGEIRLSLYRNKNLLAYDLLTEEVKSWMDDLTALLDDAESAPPPRVQEQLSRLEQSARSGRLSRRAVWILIGFFVAVSACFLLAFMVLARW